MPRSFVRHPERKSYPPKSVSKAAPSCGGGFLDGRPETAQSSISSEGVSYKGSCRNGTMAPVLPAATLYPVTIPFRNFPVGAATVATSPRSGGNSGPQ